jgi:hypothetical protein
MGAVIGADGVQSGLDEKSLSNRSVFAVQTTGEGRDKN